METPHFPRAGCAPHKSSRSKVAGRRQAHEGGRLCSAAASFHPPLARTAADQRPVGTTLSLNHRTKNIYNLHHHRNFLVSAPHRVRRGLEVRTLPLSRQAIFSMTNFRLSIAASCSGPVD
ncbi:hypothetical protein E2C01_015042 [Portunus trituberculatus]|uniref:Uncharacterized protein n=1 Tax=Portunus trituberculatus TaxID=210409 RepID=A0A5B7DM38_PORTR|nr:hypothetical protein [Portunus trituberculatus]